MSTRTPLSRPRHAATGVLANDTDPDTGDAATLVVSAVLAGTSGTPQNVVAGTATVAHGTYGDLSINADGTYSYTPNDASAEALAQGVTADDVFTYTAEDTHGAVSTTTLTFHITGIDDPPMAVADVVNVNEDVTASANFRATGVLANDTDPDTGDAATLVVSAVLAGTSGTPQNVVAGTATVIHGTYGDLSINADGTYSYTPNNANAEALAQGVTADDVFTYTAMDTSGATSNATLTFHITGQADPLVAVADVVNVNEDATASATSRATGVLANDTDPDNGNAATLVVSAVLAGTSGTALVVVSGTATVAHGIYGDLSINADGTYSYTPNDAAAEALAQGVTADDVFTYTAKDTHGAASSTTLTFHITGTNDAPVVASADRTESAGFIAGGGGTDALSGVIHFIDVNSTDRPAGSASVASIAYTDANGTTLQLTTPQINAIEADFSVTAAGGNTNDGAVNWNYSIADSALAFLTHGQTVTLTETVTVSDGHPGGTDASTVTLSLHGPDHPPVITSAPESGAVTGDLSLTVPLGELVVNGSFESALSNGWTVVLGNPGDEADQNGNHHSGSDAGSFRTTSGGGPNDYVRLSQSFNTVAGISYTVSFWVSSQSPVPGGSTSFIHALWDGTTDLTLTNMGTGGGNNFVQYTFNVIGTGHDTLELDMQDWWSTISLDDVSVKAVNVTPGIETTGGQITFTDQDTTDTHVVSAVAVGSNMSAPSRRS